MAASPRITLEQWQAFVAVVEAGGYARAAQSLHKSQSTVTYGVQRIQDLLGVRLFELRRRKAVVTPTGQLLYQRGSGDPPGVRDDLPELAGDSLPRDFRRRSPHTHIEVFEAVISGTIEAIEQGKADLAITARDLRMHRHLVVRDIGSARSKASVSVDAAQRWTVSQFAPSVEAARLGMGFARFPAELIRAELAAGTLAPLPLGESSERFAQLYLVIPDGELAGPGVLRLAKIVGDTVRSSFSEGRAARREGDKGRDPDGSSRRRAATIEP